MKKDLYQSSLALHVRGERDKTWSGRSMCNETPCTHHCTIPQAVLPVGRSLVCWSQDPYDPHES